MIMKKVYQYILMAVAIVTMASCSEKEMFEPDAQKTTALRVVVGDFPAFDGNPQTRASNIGTPDAGKTQWAENDEIIITVKSEKNGTQYTTLTYDGEEWCFDDYLKYLEGENEEDGTLEVTALYAPCYEVLDDAISLKEGMIQGMDEYLEVKCHIENRGVLQIPFSQADRTYSRLRIAAMPEATLTVTTEGFTPAGATVEATEAYTLTADDKGNAYLYGTFAEEATVSVKQGDITLKDYTFTADKNPNGTEHNKSYALDARPVIDGTLGGKTEAEESDIRALMDIIKNYVANGITTLIVTGSEPAIKDMGSWTNTAIGEAIYRLSGDGTYSEDNQYNGKIDLILQDVREIVEQEFFDAYALNSINLPKVTKIGNEAFQGCYYLKQLTFGSVLTEIVETGGGMFSMVGKEVGNCDLVLNCGQMNGTSIPDLTANTWTIRFTYEFKSITLTHTGECDECKANQ